MTVFILLQEMAKNANKGFLDLRAQIGWDASAPLVKGLYRIRLCIHVSSAAFERFICIYPTLPPFPVGAGTLGQGGFQISHCACLRLETLRHNFL